MINDRFHRIGEEVSGTGWVVIAIDVDRRSVTLSNAKGENITIFVHRSEGNN